MMVAAHLDRIRVVSHREEVDGFLIHIPVLAIFTDNKEHG